MDKIRFFFIALLGMGAAHLSAQTADSTQTSGQRKVLPDSS
jgi:hypothetical protein